MRAWTQRPGGPVDAYGQPTGMLDVLADEPCSWWVTSGQEQVRPQRTVTLAGEFARFARGADVRPGDRIRRLVDQLGETRWDTTGGEGLAREVEHVAVRRGHVECRLRSVT